MQAPDENEDQGGGELDTNAPAPTSKKDKSVLMFGAAVAVIVIVALVVRACHGA